MARRIRVCTYNVLSSSLCEPDYYSRSDPANLHPPTRLKRVQDKLSEEAAKHAIICLQEVSETWLSSLRPFFESKGYKFINSQYGNKFNDFMGVAVAYPTAIFEEQDVLITRVADAREWPVPPVSFSKWLLDTITSPFEYIRGLVYGPRPAAVPDPNVIPPFDPYDEAQRRKNTLVAAKLRLKDATSPQPFVVGTYHMPCLFGSAIKRQTMTIHTALVLQCIQKFADNGALPHILAGDFNFKPHDACYSLITQGSMAETHEDFPTPKPYDRTGWSCNTQPGGPLTSAYASVTGKESEVTNHSFSGIGGAFSGCLDYIFMSKHWTASNIVPVPKLSELTEYWPSATEPSDHLLIAADLQLKQ